MVRPSRLGGVLERSSVRHDERVHGARAVTAYHRRVRTGRSDENEQDAQQHRPHRGPVGLEAGAFVRSAAWATAIKDGRFTLPSKEHLAVTD